MTTGPGDAPGSARPSGSLGNDTLALRTVHHGTTAPQHRDATTGRRRTVNRHRTAMVVGTVAVLAAAVGATALTGSPHGPDGTDDTAQLAVPVVTSATPPAAGPAITPAPPPAGRRLGPVDGDGPVPRPATPALSPASSPPLPAPAPSGTPQASTPSGTPPKPATTDGDTGRCTVPHLPGTPCESDNGPSTASPSRTPVGLCCGAVGPEVADLQYRLQLLDLYKAEADGVYSRSVADAVTAYQRRRHIKADPPGQYGPATKAALQREVPDLVEY